MIRFWSCHSCERIIRVRIHLVIISFVLGLFMVGLCGQTTQAQDDATMLVVAEGAPTDAVVQGTSGQLLLNLRDTSVDAVLEYLSEVAGLIVIKDVDVSGRISVISRQPLTVEETVEVLNTALREKGYATIRHGRALKIVAIEDAKQEAIPVHVGNNPDRITQTDELITQVIPLHYADATQLKSDLSPLIPSYADLSANASSNSLILTDTSTNVHRIVRIVKALDTALSGVKDVKVFPLNYADAVDTARLINDVFGPDRQQQLQNSGRRRARQISSFFSRFSGQSDGRGQPSGGRGGRGRNNANGPDTQSRGQNEPTVTASADQRTNTVVVSGSADVLQVVTRVIDELDANPTSKEDVFIYHCKNSDAAKLAPMLNTLFMGQPTSSGGGRRGGRQSGRTTPRRDSQGASDDATALVGNVKIVADAATNSLLVLTASKNIPAVREILEELDYQVPQVYIRVLIVEVTHDDILDLGVEFSVLDADTGAGGDFFTDFGIDAAAGGFVFRLADQDLGVVLRALQKAGKLDVLSRPHILTSDNHLANITVGNEVPFVTNTRFTENGDTLNTVQYQDIGIILNVTPHINPDGLVTMDIEPEISAITGQTLPISETVDAAVFAKRSASTRVTLKDGQTIVIGGLMEDRLTETVSKVPLLGDIPLLGEVFKRTEKTKSKTELLIFLTPHVARRSEELNEISEVEEQGAEITPDAVEPGIFEKQLQMMRGRTPQHKHPQEEENNAGVELAPEP